LLQDVECEFPEYYLYCNRNLTDLGPHWMICDEVVGCYMFITFALYSGFFKHLLRGLIFFARQQSFLIPVLAQSHTVFVLPFLSCTICCPYVSWNRGFFCRPHPDVVTASFLLQLYQVLCTHT
jgi:hypothetical protein